MVLTISFETTTKPTYSLPTNTSQICSNNCSRYYTTSKRTEVSYCHYYAI